MSGELTPAHVRAARALLGWSTSDLVRRCGVSAGTLNRLQRAEADDVSVTLRNATRVRRALEEAGIVIVNDHEHLGVLLCSQGNKSG